MAGKYAIAYLERLTPAPSASKIGAKILLCHGGGHHRSKFPYWRSGRRRGHADLPAAIQDSCRSWTHEAPHSTFMSTRAPGDVGGFDAEHIARWASAVALDGRPATTGRRGRFSRMADRYLQLQKRICWLPPSRTLSIGTPPPATALFSRLETRWSA